MNNLQIIGMLLGAISVLSSVIAFIYRDSSQRSREYADEWRAAFKEQQQVVEVNTKALEQVVSTVGSIQKSEEQSAEMLRDLWYRHVPDESRGGPRNVR